MGQMFREHTVVFFQYEIHKFDPISNYQKYQSGSCKMQKHFSLLTQKENLLK